MLLTELNVNRIEPDGINHATKISIRERALRCTLKELNTTVSSVRETDTCDVVSEGYVSRYSRTRFGCTHGLLAPEARERIFVTKAA